MLLDQCGLPWHGSSYRVEMALTDLDHKTASDFVFCSHKSLAGGSDDKAGGGKIVLGYRFRWSKTQVSQWEKQDGSV